MRICIDLTSLADNFSGIERYAACLSLEMIKAHDDEYILVFKREIHPLFDEVCKWKNVKTIILSECNKLLFNQIRLPLALKTVQADWFLFLAFPVPILFFKKNIVETIHDLTAWDCPETMKGIMNWYFKISHLVALKKCKAIITISEFSKKRIVDRLNYPESKIWLAYCGIDQNQFIVHKDKFEFVKKKYNLPEKYILSLSTLEPRKNLSLLIHTYEELVIEDKVVLPLVLAGRKGWKMDNLLSSIDERARKRIHFTGFVDDVDLPELYALAALFVFPSMYEGFGLPPLEAMACECPVLVSDAASLPEVCGNAAAYFHSNNSTDLKKKILQCLEKTTAFDCQKGKKRIGLFNWGREAGLLYSFLSK